MKKHNFSAGPAILPASVFEQASQGVLDLNGIGLSILEISHRSPEFTAILDEAMQRVRDLLQVPETHEVLFLSGGASSQFFMTAMNLLPSRGKAGYLDTGSWSAKAIKEAKLFGEVEVVASSKQDNYTHIPKSYIVHEDCVYLHITTNNTIFGTQIHQLPETSIPLVADMSSDIFCRPIDVSRYSVIYAGAQKNLGPAGTTLVIVNKEALGKVDRAIPSMLDYRVHIEKKSTFNTPPVYPIYVSLLTLRWIEEQGGLKALEKYNFDKAGLIYEEIDRNQLFNGISRIEDRSMMNATFRINYPELEKPFLDACAAAGCVGVKGHRSVGGFRASIYNAMPYDSVKVLVDVMREFERTHG